MQRWALVRGEQVRDYLLSAGDPSPEQFNMRAWGAPESVREDGARVEDEGQWVRVPPGAGLVGDKWSYVNGAFVPLK